VSQEITIHSISAHELRERERREEAQDKVAGHFGEKSATRLRAISTGNGSLDWNELI